VIVKIAAFVVPLGFDTLAVAIALGLRGLGPLRAALAFAFFEAVMPLVGLLLGHFVATWSCGEARAPRRSVSSTRTPCCPFSGTTSSRPSLPTSTRA
jgi:hypothetical protein